MSEQSGAPALALRVLRIFIPGISREALVGDLLEEFRNGRSRWWFWREVLLAVLFAFKINLQEHQAEIVFAIGITLLRVVLLKTPWWGTLWRSHLFEAFYSWGIGWPWPMFMAYNLTFLTTLKMAMICSAAAAFLTLTRRFRGHATLRAILITFPIVAAGQVAAVSYSVSFLSRFLWQTLDSVPFFVALLIVTWRKKSPLEADPGTRV